ncbi:CDP-alcohol phosphatidyltransferase family protein [Methylophaga sp.]|uniref:CDP-alcohol phosphatidyltransferase family protein n=1 Tax=Methylophaga sp. TaxID=2024840 RepID=UPI002724822E|nr:CDP-alcohol phosphatidyltransferase family protein [Methylophaga sp.]MDO8825633.1 CDP-alcohol phosphatidyltransferase family protein [Methylophaga sp.]
MSPRDIPNLICLFRILLVGPIVWLMLHENFSVALLLVAIAGISDGLDGFLARHFHWQSRLGSIIDPLADKLLLVATFATLTYMQLLPLWLLLLVLGRDILIVCGALAYHLKFGEYELTPLWSSKINTVFQIALVLLVIVQQQWLPQAATWSTTLIWLVVASVIISGSEYIVVWGTNAWRQKNKN